MKLQDGFGDVRKQVSTSFATSEKSLSTKIEAVTDSTQRSISSIESSSQTHITTCVDNSRDALKRKFDDACTDIVANSSTAVRDLIARSQQQISEQVKNSHEYDLKQIGTLMPTVSTRIFGCKLALDNLGFDIEERVKLLLLPLATTLGELSGHCQGMLDDHKGFPEIVKTQASTYFLVDSVKDIVDTLAIAVQDLSEFPGLIDESNAVVLGRMDTIGSQTQQAAALTNWHVAYQSGFTRFLALLTAQSLKFTIKKNHAASVELTKKGTAAVKSILNHLYGTIFLLSDDLPTNNEMQSLHLNVAQAANSTLY